MNSGELLGVFQGTAKDFGFVILEDSSLKDVYVHASKSNGAIDGDKVLIKIIVGSYGEQRAEGEVIKVIERGNNKVVGVLSYDGNFEGYVVTPDSKRLNQIILIPDPGRASVNDKVLIKITSNNNDCNLKGEIIEVLGKKDDPKVGVLAVIRKYNLAESFSEEVTQEADNIPVDIGSEDLTAENRQDLRSRTIVTIDGDDAKDLDDAISVEELDGGLIRLGVHIADVSYYVKSGSALDLEAYSRGCSVYLPDRVIPMLPERLSNGICSLHPKVDRLTMTCDMDIDESGSVVRHKIYPSIICTKERMTYKDVTKILEEPNNKLEQKYGYLFNDFRLMAKLAKILENRRSKRGSLDFNFPETKVIMSEDQNRVVNIVKRDRTVSERIIEEFMLVANETVAEHFNKLEIPFVYRIHEKPDEVKLQSFFEFITTLGYTSKGKAGKVTGKDLQKLLSKTKDSPQENIINTILLRSMKQAKYDTQCSGHFGLGAKYYSHFTSPIRRYPDLLIHRVIRDVLTNKISSQKKLNKFLDEAANQSSIRERISVDAEREVISLKKTEFMEDKIGKEYKGVISSITSFGIFVELDNTVEGLIHVRNLVGDYFQYDAKRQILFGERTRKTYRLGDSVLIKVISINKEEKKVDFSILKHFAEKPKNNRSKNKRSSSKRRRNKKS